MTCAACAEREVRLQIAEERVRQLEDELGAQNASVFLTRLLESPAFLTIKGGRPQACQVIAALYGAKGKVVSHQRLFQVVPPRDLGADDDRGPNFMSVLVHRARKALGLDAIQNVHGVGYRLTDVGMARVAAIIESRGPSPASEQHGGSIAT